MRWSERMKLSFETFKRVALPLYGWYFIFALAGVVLVIAAMIPFFVSVMSNGFSGLHTFPGSSSVPNVPVVPGVPTSPFSGPFPNPNPPMPPGSSFSGGSFSNGPFNGLPGGGPFGLKLAPFMSNAPLLLIVFGVITVVFWVATSAFMAGTFHLTHKGIREKVFFRDFRFSGFPRVLGWYGILTVVSLLLTVGGVAGALALRGQSYAIPIFGGLYILLIAALGLILAPWLLTSVFFMLLHRELSFGKALSESWKFYRRHLGDLWLFLITLIGIQILLSLINHNSPSLGFLISLIVGPFTAILPIVWVISLDDEDHPATSSFELKPDIATGYSMTSPEIPSEDFTTPSETTSSVNPQTEDSHETPVPSNPFTVPFSTPSPSNPIATSDSTAPTSSEESPQENLNYCPTCGRQTRPGANYCAQCGTKL